MMTIKGKQRQQQSLSPNKPHQEQMALLTPPGLPQTKLDFIKSFYSVSDDPHAVDKYLEHLTEDADFIMGLKAMKGHSEVRKLRETMWGGVTTRHHKPTAVYNLNPDFNDLMLYGTVDYGLKNGNKVSDVGWAARMLFDHEGKRMKSYQVWLDSTPLANALKEL